jgi:hypothetical protein
LERPGCSTWFVGVAEGKRVNAPAGAPSLGGQVEKVGPSEFPELLLRLDEPAPGLAHFFALPMGGKVYMIVRVYLYGPRAAAVASREESVWQSWIGARFPAMAEDAPG